MKELEYPKYDLVVKSSTSQLAAIRSFIQVHAEENNVKPQVIEALILAADEAATNIVKHAYHQKTDQDILVDMLFKDGECTITLTDYGDPFDPSLVPQPDMQEYLKQRRVGGLGLYLIRTLMDGLEYESNRKNLNKLTLRKRFV
ncbi:MAG: ATP-binding protein [Ignavibacteria bacterium]|nr:ATP-binding protein [Ignavibacteria bacterium]